MNKNVVLVALSIILLGGCSQINDTETIEKVDLVSVEVGDTVATESVNSVATENTFYSLKCVQLPDLGLIYPQIYGSEDCELEEKINQTLYQRGVSTYLDNWNNEGLSVEGSYSVVLQTNSYLSVLFKGFVYVEGAAHPSYTCFAVTIDMKTGETCVLNDFLNIDALRQRFAPESFVMVEGVPDILSRDSAGKSDIDIYHDLIERYIYYPIIYADDLHSYDYYLTDQKIGLIVGFPFVYGNYAIFEGPRERI